MQKIISLTFATLLTLVAVSFWFKPSVSQTVTSDRVQTISVSELHRNADMKSMPIQAVDDKSVEFTSPIFFDPAQ